MDMLPSLTCRIGVLLSPFSDGEYEALAHQFDSDTPMATGV